MPRALEQIRRMRGGAQSHLMRCADGHYYVVKLQNNPQHRRILVNELLGTRLASRLGLPTAPVAIIEVSEELIRLTPDLVMEHPRHRFPCHAGPQFGSRYPGDPRRLTLHDFLPDQQLLQVENLHDFAGMLVFEEWTCNTNGRQTLFLADWSSTAATAADVPASAPASSGGVAYRTLMIDQGFCFNAGEWKFPDAPLRGFVRAQPRLPGHHRHAVLWALVGAPGTWKCALPSGCLTTKHRGPCWSGQFAFGKWRRRLAAAAV